MPAPPRVCVFVTRPGLASALSHLVSRRVGVDVESMTALDGDLPARILLTTTVDCDVARCTSLAAAGMDVVVLAVMPGDAERATYLAAGAKAYLAMELDVAPLVAVIEELLD